MYVQRGGILNDGTTAYTAVPNKIQSHIGENTNVNQDTLAMTQSPPSHAYQYYVTEYKTKHNIIDKFNQLSMINRGD